MRLVFPNSHRINRGNYVVKELADACRANDVTDLIVLHEHRGIPGTTTIPKQPNVNWPLVFQMPWLYRIFLMAPLCISRCTTLHYVMTLIPINHPPFPNNILIWYSNNLPQNWVCAYETHWNICFLCQRRTVDGLWHFPMKTISSRSGKIFVHECQGCVDIEKW